MEEIIAPINKEILKAELTEDKRLRFTNKSHNEIYVITYQDSPNVMKEIGRLREIAFRAAGGGTGKSMDIDEYDIMENPYKQLVYMEKFCLKVGFNERQTATLISGKPLFYEGELYSEEHKRKFTTERAGFQVVKDPTNRSKLALAINGQLIGEWFKEQFDRLFSSVKRTVEPLRRGKGVGL